MGKIEVLVAAMNQTDYSLLERMNIQTDAVVVNQANSDSMEEFLFRGNKIIWINMSARGVGLSRNTALMYATADIILFADEDVSYHEGYGEGIIKAFDEYENADVICFNIHLINSTKNIGGHRDNKTNKRLHVFNAMRDGACLIVARRKSLLRERIYFSLLFGGGAEFNSGEDSLFIKDCLNAGLHLYSNIFVLGNVEDSESSWYKGINDKFFVDRGMILSSAFPRVYMLILLYYSFRLSKLDTQYSFKKILKLMLDGKKRLSQYR